MATGSALWAKHFLVPQLESVGPGLIVINPRHVELNGSDIRLGSHVHMMATRDRPIRLTVFPQPGGSIDIGDYTIILPGARIASARSIQVGKNCMFATNSYVSDADWHDVYDRTAAPGAIAPIVIEDNVWVGDSAIVCKGVTIGRDRHPRHSAERYRRGQPRQGRQRARSRSPDAHARNALQRRAAVR